MQHILGVFWQGPHPVSLAHFRFRLGFPTFLIHAAQPRTSAQTVWPGFIFACLVLNQQAHFFLAQLLPSSPTQITIANSFPSASYIVIVYERQTVFFLLLFSLEVEKQESKSCMRASKLGDT